MESIEYLPSRLQCSCEDKLACLETAKKLYCLAIFARKNGILALTDAVEEKEDLFLKTMVDALVDVTDQKLLKVVFSAYIAAGNYHGKEFLKNILIVNGLLLIAQGSLPSQLVDGLQGWFGVEFAQTYKKEMACEVARLDPPVPTTQSTIPEFDRFAKFSKVHTIKLLSKVENRILSLALKGASDQVADRFFHLMESEQEEEIRTDLKLLSNVRRKDVEEAQRYILEKAKRKGEKANYGDA